MLTTEQITQIAKLTKININGKEDKLAQDLSSILDIVNALQAIDTKNVAPMSHPFDGTQRLRSDVVSENNHRDLYQQNAPYIKNGHYLVPKVL